MATLEELLAEDGFNNGKHKAKPWSRRDSSDSSDSNSLNTRFSFSGLRTPPARTISDVNSRRSTLLIPETGGFTDPRPSFAGGRLSPYAQEPKVLTSIKKYKEQEGCAGRRKLDPNFKSKTFIGMKDDSSKEIEEKWEYDRCYKNYLFVHEEAKNNESPNLLFFSKDGCHVPDLGDVALKAITSMLKSCVDRLLEDENFRSSVHEGCDSSLNSCEVEDGQTKDSGVRSSLKETIRSVERMIIEGPNQVALKKAFLNLSVISGLKSMESDDGRTSGIPNSHLAGCAHLYLCILYKIEKKDKASTKHLLQVFCDSPYQARTKLLPELWKHLCLPYLSYLQSWYAEETKSIQGTSEVMIKLEVLDKVYNDLLDVGTSQLAAYFKCCLIDDNCASALPSIIAPFPSFPRLVDDDVVSVESFSSGCSVLSRTMISKSLYESVCGQANRMDANGVLESEEKEEMDEVDEFEGKPNIWENRYDDSRQDNGEVWSHSSNLGSAYADENFQEYRNAGSQCTVLPFDSNDLKNGKSCESSSSSIVDAEEIRVESKIIQPCHTINGDTCGSRGDQQEIDFLAHNSYPNVLAEVTRTESLIYEADTTHGISDLCSMKSSPSAVLFRSHEDVDKGSLFAGVPKDFVCPLTGLLLKDPVTLECGYTFELAAIKKRFDQGCRTCPLTRQSLKNSAIPNVNLALKHMINEWVAECFTNSLSSTVKQVYNYQSELALLIFEQLLTGFSSEEKKENMKHLISLGGLHFLTLMFEMGSLEEKSRAAELLVQCIQADGHCRNFLALNIEKSSLRELIHSGLAHARSNAASLLIELICLKRRIDISSFISGLKMEASGTIMSDLLLCLKSSLPEARVLVAVLLLHLDLMEESQVFGVYSAEAVKCIITTLECCLSNKKFIANCRTALLMLGGHFSVSGEILIELWLWNQAGFDGFSFSNNDDDYTISEEEEKERDEWLKRMAAVLIGYNKKSFLETLSNCWKLGSPDLARVCLVTTAWLSHALVSLSVPALQLSSLLALFTRLKECVRSDPDVKQRVLACLCLFNLSKISECTASLKAFAEEIRDPLMSLAEVTWTAKHLYNYIFEEA